MGRKSFKHFAFKTSLNTKEQNAKKHFTGVSNSVIWAAEIKKSGQGLISDFYILNEADFEFQT